MKICIDCGKRKKIDCFHKHPGMKDGHINSCVLCRRSYAIEHRNKNIEKARAYDRKRGRTKERLAYKREQGKTYKGRYEVARKWREKNRYKKQAHSYVQCALKAGKITRLPCEVCGKIKSEAHHNDYTKPLKIKWLCKEHHAKIHRKYK